MFSKQCPPGRHAAGVTSSSGIQRAVRRGIVFWEKCVQIWDEKGYGNPKKPR